MELLTVIVVSLVILIGAFMPGIRARKNPPSKEPSPPSTYLRSFGLLDFLGERPISGFWIAGAPPKSP